MTGHVLILGSSGRFGRNMAEAFWNAGWRVHLHDRATGDLKAEAREADVIVNGWNPAYPDWAAQLPGLTARCIEAARVNDATVLIPGNVYVYGKDAAPDFGPHLPHGAQNPLGRLRIEMEQAYRNSGCKVIVLRAGDYLDTEASGNWFDRIMAPSLKKGVLTYPGNPDIPHAWAFLPDLARAGVQLVERRESLPHFADIAFPGYTLTGHELAALCGGKVKRMSWLPIWLARPVWRLAAPLLEVRYLWDKPHFMAPQSFAAVLPDFRATDPAEAVAQATAPVMASRGRPRRRDVDPAPAQA